MSDRDIPCWNALLRGRFAVALALLACVVVLFIGQAQATSGSLDPSFGSAGTVVTPLGTSAYANAVALQPDGKIVAGGASSDGSELKFAIARYAASGKLDPAFGSGGVVTTPDGTNQDKVHGLALQPDGKIVAAGQTFDGATNSFALARYQSNGALDVTFGSSGVTKTSIGSTSVAEAVALQPDGKIVVAGLMSSDGWQTRFALARYKSDGKLDAGFGTGGIVTTPSGSTTRHTRLSCSRTARSSRPDRVRPPTRPSTASRSSATTPTERSTQASQPAESPPS